MGRLNFYEQVYKVTQAIPPGKVSSYGRIAQMLGRPHAARAVGYALSALAEAGSGAVYTSATVPWQRVVNSNGRVSIHHREHTARQQIALLQAEGVAIDDKGWVDLAMSLWQGLHLVELDDILTEIPPGGAGKRP